MHDTLDTPTDSPVDPSVPARGRIYDRRTVLAQLADGETPEQVFGLAREEAAQELKGYLAGIRLDGDEKMHLALAPTRMLERRHRAYRAGVRFLYEAYYSYNLVTGPEGDVR